MSTSVTKAGHTTLEGPTNRVRPEHLPLSYSQQRLWFVDRLQGSSAEFSAGPYAVILKGHVDVAAIRWAINAIVERHESLRTHFAEIDGEPVQLIQPHLSITTPIEDVRLHDHDSREQRVSEERRRLVTEPFNLAQGPVLRNSQSC